MAAAFFEQRLIRRSALITIFCDSLFSGSSSEVTVANDLTVAAETTVSSDVARDSRNVAYRGFSDHLSKKSPWKDFLQQYAQSIIRETLEELREPQLQRMRAVLQESLRSFEEPKQGKATKSNYIEGKAQTSRHFCLGATQVKSFIAEVTREEQTHLGEEATQSSPSPSEVKTNSFPVEELFSQELIKQVSAALLPQTGEKFENYYWRVYRAISEGAVFGSDDEQSSFTQRSEKAKLTAPAVATALQFLYFPEKRFDVTSYWQNAYDTFRALAKRRLGTISRSTLQDNPQALLQSKQPDRNNPEQVFKELLSKFDGEKGGRPPLRTCFKLALHIAAKNDPGLFSLEASTAEQLRAMAKQLLAKPHGFGLKQKADAGEYLDQIYATMSARRCVAFLDSPDLYSLFEGSHQQETTSFANFRRLLSGVTKAYDSGSLDERIAEMVERSKNSSEYLSIAMVLLCCAKLVDPATTVEDHGSKKDILRIMVDVNREFTETSSQQETGSPVEGTNNLAVPTKQRREETSQKGPPAKKQRGADGAAIDGSATSPRKSLKSNLLGQLPPEDQIHTLQNEFWFCDHGNSACFF